MALCQHTWTEELLLWPEGRASMAFGSVISLLSSPSSEPDIDFKLKYLLVGDGESRPLSRAYWARRSQQEQEQEEHKGPGPGPGLGPGL